VKTIQILNFANRIWTKSNTVPHIFLCNKNEIYDRLTACHCNRFRFEYNCWLAVSDCDIQRLMLS